MGHRKPYIAQEMDYQSRYRETLGRQAEFGSSQPSGNTSASEVRRRQERGVAALSFVVIKHTCTIHFPLCLLGLLIGSLEHLSVVLSAVKMAQSQIGQVWRRAAVARAGCACLGVW